MSTYGQGNAKAFPWKLQWHWNRKYLAQPIFPHLRYVHYIWYCQFTKVPWIHMIYNVHIWYQFNFPKTQPWQIHSLLYNEEFQAVRDLAKLDTFYNSIKLIQGIVYFSIASQINSFAFCYVCLYLTSISL